MANAASAAKAKKDSRRKARAREQVKPLRSAAPTAIPVAMRQAVPPGGRSLPGDVRALMESRFNADFSRVTVHEGLPAQGYAAGRDANAYALGEHVVFDQGRYAPHSAQGQRLLAHELAHVVQQRRGGALPSPADEPVLEAHADRAADAFQKGDAAGVGVQVGGAGAAGVMCDRNGRKKKRPGSDYDDDEQFDADDDTEQARCQSEKERTQQEKSDRRNAGKSHAQIGSDEADRELRRMEDHARAPGGNQRSQKRRDRTLKRFERRLEAARGSQLDKNKRKGDFDERQRTPGGVGVIPQTDFVAGSKVLPGQQVRDEDDNSIAHHTRPDFSAIKRRKDGTWERVHFNLKANQIDRMTPGEARGAAREILYQAVKNKAHLPGEERLIISFAHPPSKELQEAIKEELFREHTPISEIRFGNVVHRNADYKPENGRIPLDVDAKDRRRRLAAEAKREKKRQDAKKKVAKKATKKTAKKAPAKKATKKATKKAPAKTATKKAPAKKAASKKSAASKPATKKAAMKAPAKKATTKKAAKPAGSAKKAGAAQPKPAQSAAGKKAAAAPRATKQKQRLRIATQDSPPSGPAASAAQRVRIAEPRVRIAEPRVRIADQAEHEAQAEREADDAHAAEKARAAQARKKASPAQPRPAAKAAPVQQQPQQSQQPAAKKPTAPTPAKPPEKPPAKVQPPSPAQTKPATKRQQVSPPAPAKPQNAPKKAPAVPQPPATKKTAPMQPPQKNAPKSAKPPGAGKGMGIAGSAQRQSFFNDQVQVSVQEQLGAEKPFRVTTAITLRGGGSFGGQASKGSSGASGNVSASGSLSISYSKWMTAQEKNQYLESISTGHGAGHAESTIIELIAGNQQDAAAEAIKKAKAKMGDRQQGEAGDTEEISVEGDVSAGAGASRGGGRGIGGHVEISSGKGIRRTRTLMEDGKELYTVTVTLRSGQSLGGTVQYGAAGGGYSDTRDETRTVYFSFLLDPEAGDYGTRKNEILAASSAEELSSLAQKHPRLAYGSGQSKAEGQVGTTSASVLGIGFDIDQNSFYEEGESQDPNGKQRHVRGGAGIGGSATILGRRINPSSKTDSFTGWVDENNVGGGVTQTESREVSWQKTAGGLADAASHPVASAVAIAKGKPILQDRVDSVGVNLTDDSFTRIANMAKDDKAWFRAWTGKGVSRGSKDDWEATRQLVLAAGNDRAKIQQAMAKWEKGDSGRSAEVERLTGGTGVSFDFPDEIIDQKPVYDQLVMSDPLAGPRQLVAEGKISEAVSRLEALNKRSGELLQTVQTHSGKATDPGKFTAVQTNIAARQKQFRQEIYRLTSPSAKAAAKAGEPPPEPVAAPPPDFVGPLSVDQQEAVKAERKEANETIHTQVGFCLVNRDIENKAFAEVADELDDFYINHRFVFEKLNSLKPMYAKWDAAIVDLKAAYTKIGDTPDRADKFTPNRSKWNALNNQGLK